MTSGIAGNADSWARPCRSSPSTHGWNGIMPTFASASATVWSCAARSASTECVAQLVHRRRARGGEERVGHPLGGVGVERARRGAALQDRSGDGEVGVGGEEVRDASGARRLAHEHDAIGVTTERADVGAQPVDRGAEIAQWEVRRHARGREPPEGAEAVVEPDHHDVVRGEVHAVVERKRGAADPVAPAGHPHEHRTRAVERGRADLGGEARLGLRVGDHPGHEVEPADGLRGRCARRRRVERLAPRDRLGQLPAVRARVRHAAEAEHRRRHVGRRPGPTACRRRRWSRWSDQ